MRHSPGHEFLKTLANTNSSHQLATTILVGVILMVNSIIAADSKLIRKEARFLNLRLFDGIQSIVIPAGISLWLLFPENDVGSGLHGGRVDWLCGARSIMRYVSFMVVFRSSFVSAKYAYYFLSTFIRPHSDQSCTFPSNRRKWKHIFIHTLT